jgi:hypothetical protein
VKPVVVEYQDIHVVPVVRKFGFDPTLLATLSSVNLVPSILTPLNRGGWTVSKNTNHSKTCNTIYQNLISIEKVSYQVNQPSSVNLLHFARFN